MRNILILKKIKTFCVQSNAHTHTHTYTVAHVQIHIQIAISKRNVQSFKEVKMRKKKKLPMH